MATYAELSEQVEGKNINTKTLLATDYLNHFNEVIMLLQMIPDMPELIDDARAWQPKTYVQHFLDSSFTNKDLAVEAYEYVPAKYKKAFEYIVEQMDNVVLTAISQMEAFKNDQIKLLEIAGDNFLYVRKLIEVASSIINGVDFAQNQTSVDSIIEN